MKTVDGQSFIFSGSNRTGKSAKASQVLAALKLETVFVWDIEAQWCEIKGFKKLSTLAELKQVVKAGKKGKYALVFVGADMQEGFNQFCACVFHYLQYFGPCGCVAEELADVSSPGKAPQYWGMLVRRGLKRGLYLFSISQRWQEADKTAIGNSSEMFIFTPSTFDDAKYIAGKIGQEPMAVLNLPQFSYMHWVKFKGVTIEKLTFKKG